MSSCPSGQQYVGVITKMKPLRTRSKELKQEVIAYMKKRKLDSIQVGDQKINLVNKRIKRTLNLKLLKQLIQDYTTEDTNQAQLHEFVEHVANHLDENAVVKESLQFKT